MLRNVIDQLKSLTYGMIRYKGATIRYTQDGVIKQSNQRYFFNNTSYPIYHLDYFIIYRTDSSSNSGYTYLNTATTTAKIIDHFKEKISRKLVEQSTDSRQETVLHYFLRHFTVFPEKKYYGVNSCQQIASEKVPDDYPVQEVAQYHPKDNQNFDDFFKKIAPLNDQVAEKILKPALADLKTPEMLRALLVRDSLENTPLHYGTSTPGSGIFTRLQVVLDEVKNIDDVEQKKHLLNARNKNGLSILDNAAKNPNPDVLKAIRVAFGLELITEYICTKEKTFFSSLNSNTPTAIVSILDHLRPSDSDLKKPSEEKKGTYPSIPQQFLVIDTKIGKNFVHSVCRKLRDDPNTPPAHTQALILKVFSLLKEKNLGDDALVSTAANGFNPLHYLCRSGQIDDFNFLDHISPSQFSRSLSTKAKNGYTPLHYVCLHGNVLILNSLLKKAPATAYDLLKQHQSEFVALAKKNKTLLKLPPDELTQKLHDLQTLNPALCDLIDMYRYLDQRRKQNDRDYKDRKFDFLNQFQYIPHSLSRGDTPTFTAATKFMTLSNCCFFQGFRTQRYYNHMDRLAHSANSLTQKTLTEFTVFLQSQGENVLAKDILAKLKPPAANLSASQSTPYPLPTASPATSRNDNDPPPYSDDQASASYTTRGFSLASTTI